MLVHKLLAQTLFAQIAQATHDGVGITRESYGPGEEQAMVILEKHAACLGLHSSRDALQNLWISLDASVAVEPSIVIGSHLDSVPQGGNFDGLAGIVAGILVLLEIKAQGLRTPHPVKLVALRAEESAWYGKAYLGSSAALGVLSPCELANLRRNGSNSLQDAMVLSGADISLIQQQQALLGVHNVRAYLELHIEQGPIMVARQWPIAAVSGIRGNIRHNLVRCVGQAGHSGAVPRWLRKDALLAVAELLTRLDEHWRVLLQMGMDLVMTVGVLTTPTASHAVSVIPSEVQFSFEVHSQDKQTLERFYALMQQECESIAAARQIEFVFDRKITTAPAAMCPRWLNKLVACARSKDYDLGVIPSGAGHDAAVFANADIPTAMIFIRNENGSHNANEAMDIDDFLMGCELLLDAVLMG